MGREHEPGCDGRHAPRERCNGSLPSATPPGSPAPPAARSFCTGCGTPNSLSARYCKHCGASMAQMAAGRVAGIAFLLNEIESPALRDIVRDADRVGLRERYEREMRALTAPPPAAAPAPMPTLEPAPQPTPAMAPHGREPAVRVAVAPRMAPPRPPSPPRAPRDWSWLAEQQANLFLFAGAFLVVVAALIYVAYSGQAVSGALKMTLLAGFTIAFLAAGAACLRIPRVVMAGQVFFAVGAILVPIGFAAAHTILSDRDLDPQALWLAGSLTTAAFYTAVATLGIGRLYSFASGIALMSATAAVCAVAEVPVEWAPVAFIALALAMSGAAIAGPSLLRQRVGTMWEAQAHAVAAVSMCSAIIIALAAAPAGSEIDLTSRWFLPATFGCAALYAAVATAHTRAETAGYSSIVTAGGALVTVVYALSLPAEQYAIAFASLALLLGVASPLFERELVARRTPKTFAEFAHSFAIASTFAAAGVALLLATEERSADPAADLTPESAWFAAPAFALLIAFYAIDAFGRRQRFALGGTALAVAGFGASLVYGLGASEEHYALALAGAGLAFVGFTGWIAPRIPARFAPAHADEDARVYALAALAGAVGAALFALSVDADESVVYAPQTPWFLLMVFGTTAAALALYMQLPMPVTRWQDSLAPYGLAFAVAGGALSIVYGLDASGEYYAVALACSSAAVAAGYRVVLARTQNPVLRAYIDPGVDALAQAGAAIGVVIAIIAIGAAQDADSAFEPATRWFLLESFAGAGIAYVVLAARRVTVAEWHTQTAHAGAALSIIGACAAGVYGLDASAEYYAFAFVAGAVALLPIVLFVLPRVQPADAARTLSDVHLPIAHAAAVVAGLVAIGVVLAAADDNATYHPESRWFLPAVFAALGAFYAVATRYKLRPFAGAEPMPPLAFVASGLGITTGVVYALDASPEYHAYAFVGPALALGAVARFANVRVLDDALPARWRDAAFIVGRIVAGVGVSVAIVAAAIGASGDSTYVPDTRAYLLASFGAAALFLALDASRRREWRISAAFVAMLVGVALAVPYAFEAGPEHYGVAFAAAGAGIAFTGRTWSPAWLHARARDIVAVVAVTLAWLLFEGVYADEERIGAGVHLAAAAFYAFAALLTRPDRMIGDLWKRPRAMAMPLAATWLYASGLVGSIGYILLLRAMRDGGDMGGRSLALSLLALAVVFIALGATSRYWRTAFGAHLYVMATLAAVAALAASPDASALAVVSTALAAAFIVAGLWEDAPAIAVPGAVAGFIAVAAWQQRIDAAPEFVPVTYAAIALCAYMLGYAIRGRQRWSNAARACGAGYAIVAPAAGYGMLGFGTDGGLYDGARYEETALYQWSTAAVAVAGVIAVLESSIARRGWIVVAGSGVLVASLMLEIGHFRPDSLQPYAATLGLYLVLLGLVGLWRFRLIPEFENAAPPIEALGAIVVMYPSFMQALSDGFPYQLIALVEAAFFFTLSVVLRRRLLLGTATLALVLIAGRALFDAINALPNWIVILIAGMALLGIGTAILVGRDRWGRWEGSIMSWWDEMGGPEHAQ